MPSLLSIGGKIISVVATKKDILGTIQTSRANGGERQADCHRMPGCDERFSGVQEQVDERPS